MITILNLPQVVDKNIKREAEIQRGKNVNKHNKQVPIKSKTQMQEIEFVGSPAEKNASKKRNSSQDEINSDKKTPFSLNQIHQEQKSISAVSTQSSFMSPSKKAILQNPTSPSFRSLNLSSSINGFKLNPFS